LELPKREVILPRIRDQDYEIGNLAAIAEKFGGKLIGFDVADPSSDTPPQVMKAMFRALKRPDATHYTRIRGLPAFVTTVAKFYDDHFGVKVDPYENVMSTVGSGEALYILFESMVAKGDEFILPNPTFPTYASLLHLKEGTPKFVPLQENYHLDLEAIKRAISRKTKAIVICTPNNPTGAVYQKNELAELLNIARENDLVIISDENYSQVAYDHNKHFSIASLPDALERTIVVNGLSKVYSMTGFRLGYIIANGDFINQFEKVGYDIRGSVNTAVQYAGASALNTKASGIRSIVRDYDKKRRLIVKLLRESGFTCHMPEGGFEAFPRIPEYFKDSVVFTEFLAENAGVLVKPGIYFGPDGGKNFRMVYCKGEKTIIDGMERIRKTMRKLPIT
jgi:aspartate/methionine/tyrosine aminotransferase